MSDFVWKLLWFIGFILVCALVAFYIYVFATYGGKSVDEIPFWAAWFLWRR